MSLQKLLYVLISILFSLLYVLAQQNSGLRSYIIHVKKLDDDHSYNNINHTTTINYHKSFLPDTATSNDSLIYSYKHVISGFAARLTADEIEDMKKNDGFVSAHPKRMYQLSTTRSPAFLGLHEGMGLWNQSKEGKGVIIGVVDSGISPSHPSFSDVNMSAPPTKWKGRCEFTNKTDQCNNKIIGARFFYRLSESGEYSPLDQNGHGTHVAGTAAGGFVENACFLGGIAFGRATGMAPQAHLAIYRVCGDTWCEDIDILAGIDAAIEDGVDVLSISLGPPDSSIPFHADLVAIGAFAAVQKGIFVSCSGGNGGPFKQTVINDAPWVLTVGASTIDRRLVATAKLGNEQEFDGESAYQPNDFGDAGKMLPLVYGAYCGNLSSFDVKGKVVLCDGYWQDIEVKDAGGAATILANLKQNGFIADAEFIRVLPAAIVSYTAGQNIKAYINSTKLPVATILFKGTLIGDPLDPIVAAFSSRGPSLEAPRVLKPDIIGPGVNILAASPFHFDNDIDSKLTFDIKSGTSQSAPHLAGVAALLKSAHPSWSPAAIKSAIMTTANLLNVQRTRILDEKLTPADFFATGAGHVNPSKAVDPGLVYDIDTDDYIPFLCGLGYTDKQVGIIARKPVKCTSLNIPPGQLNYPTFSVLLGSSPQTFQRTVTNVGENYSYYIAMVIPVKGVKIVVRPRQLWFPRVNKKATYNVTFSRSNNTVINNDTYSQGYLQWVSRKHTVRSVISVQFTGQV